MIRSIFLSSLGLCLLPACSAPRSGPPDGGGSGSGGMVASGSQTGTGASSSDGGMSTGGGSQNSGGATGEGGGASGGTSAGGSGAGAQNSGGSSAGGNTGGSGGSGETGGSSGSGSGGDGSGGGGNQGTTSGRCRSFDNGSGTTQPCYVGDDGVAYCIADDGSTTALSGIPGSAVNATGQNFTTAACAVNDSGAVYCGQYESMSEWIASGATQVSGSLNGQCALVGGAVQCSGVEGPDAPTLPSAVTQISCYYHGCCAATDDGKMYCWGDTAAFGETTTDPVEVPLPAGKNIVDLGPGQDHICALVDGGQVQCWGQDWNAQLGGLTSGGTNTSDGVTLVESGAVAVAAGQFHTCVAFEDGHVECTSANQTEGAGLDMGELSPVSGISTAVALSAGKHYSCALLADSSIKCWGRIGGGTTPVDVTGPAAAACD